jgi:hypothetical protein
LATGRCFLGRYYFKAGQNVFWLHREGRILCSKFFRASK